MTKFPAFALLICAFLFIGCQSESETSETTPAINASSSVTLVDQIVEASCGECQFGMEGSGCDLAIRIDGKSYYVDGSSIDDHGDAHGDEGMCNAIRKAKVTGEIKDDRFVAASFELLPDGE